MAEEGRTLTEAMDQRHQKRRASRPNAQSAGPDVRISADEKYDGPAVRRLIPIEKMMKFARISGAGVRFTFRRWRAPGTQGPPSAPARSIATPACVRVAMLPAPRCFQPGATPGPPFPIPCTGWRPCCQNTALMSRVATKNNCSMRCVPL